MESIQNLARVLTSRGYSIRKDSLTEDENTAIRKELTVTPFQNAKFAKGAEPFPVFYESPQRLYVPRQWGLQKFGIPQANIVAEGIALPSQAKFTGKPFDYQNAIIDKFTKAGANGLICVPCGKGKTFMALAIAAKLGKRFCIVVDKEFLLNQWKSEIDAFFPGLRVGIFQGPKQEVDPEQYDCTICMLQSVIQKPVADQIFSKYGFTIFDECHHLGAAHFSKVLMKIQTKWMLGLSATPTRDDGLTKVFEWYLGVPVYWEKIREPDATVSVYVMSFHYEDPTYAEAPVDWKGDVVMARLLGQIVGYEPRTQAIAEIIRQWIAESSERRILVLSERKEHLNRFEELLRSTGVNIGYYIGGMTDKDRELSATESRIILATYAMASEAMNIKTLNAVVLASPRKKVEQSTGRILRIRPEQRNLEHRILDFIDGHDMYLGQWRKRLSYYKQCHYKIYQLDENGEKTLMVKPVEKKPEVSFEGCAINDSDSDSVSS